MNQLTDRAAAKFDVILAQVNSPDNINLVRITKEITATAETIEMIAQATEQASHPHVTTFLSN